MPTPAALTPVVPSTVPTDRGLTPLTKSNAPVVAADRTRTLLAERMDTGPEVPRRRLVTVKEPAPSVTLPPLRSVIVLQPAGATIGALMLIGPSVAWPTYRVLALMLFNSACVSPRVPGM